MAGEDTSSRQKLLQPVFAPQGGAPPLMPMPVNQVAITVTTGEIILTLGQSRVVFRPEQGLPNPIIGTEFTSALSLPPPVAINLYRSLELAIGKYEETFGKIPADPDAKLQFQKIVGGQAEEVTEVAQSAKAKTTTKKPGKSA